MIDMDRKSPDVHVTVRLYSPDLDFNCFDSNPLGSYMLASIPRSGSTYCAIKFWQTGLLGAPVEYLNFHVVAEFLQRLGYRVDENGGVPIQQMSGYWRNVQRLRSSPNGMFGYKMFATNYREIARRVPEFLREITPHYVIYLTRKDVVGQAMSYSRAQRSKVWFAGVARTPEVDYDYAHIKSCLRSIEAQKTAWEHVFALTGIEPIRITYEDMLASPSAVVGRVLNAMGIEPDMRCAVSVPMIERQTDGISKAWRERFMQDSLEDIMADATSV